MRSCCICSGNISWLSQFCCCACICCSRAGAGAFADWRMAGTVSSGKFCKLVGVLYYLCSGSSKIIEIRLFEWGAIDEQYRGAAAQIRIQMSQNVLMKSRALFRVLSTTQRICLNMDFGDLPVTSVELK